MVGYRELVTPVLHRSQSHLTQPASYSSGRSQFQLLQPTVRQH
jgi:hypothetical protein